MQKHLIYFNEMIEKHSISSSPEENTVTTKNDNISKKSEMMVDFDLDLTENESSEQPVVTPSPSSPPETRSSPLTTILPLVSTVMTMMNNNTPDPNEVINSQSAYIEEVHDSESNEQKQNLLKDEIKEELQNLKTSVNENRELKTSCKRK